MPCLSLGTTDGPDWWSRRRARCQSRMGPRELKLPAHNLDSSAIRAPAVARPPNSPLSFLIRVRRPLSTSSTSSASVCCYRDLRRLEAGVRINSPVTSGRFTSCQRSVSQPSAIEAPSPPPIQTRPRHRVSLPFVNNILSSALIPAFSASAPLRPRIETVLTSFCSS